MPRRIRLFATLLPIFLGLALFPAAPASAQLAWTGDSTRPQEFD